MNPSSKLTPNISSKPFDITQSLPFFKHHETKKVSTPSVLWVDEAERIEISVELLAALMAEYSRQLEELYLVTPYDEFKILELKAQRKNHQLELIRVRKGDPQVIEQVLTHYPERLRFLLVQPS